LPRGRKEAKGGHCLVAWTKVCLPKELGGLGISDLGNLWLGSLVEMVVADENRSYSSLEKISCASP